MDEITLTPKIKKLSGKHTLSCFGEDSPCAIPHGHTWWVQPTFAGVPDKRGVLIDYEVVDAVVNEFGPAGHCDLDAAMAPALATGENILLRLVERFKARCAAQGPHVRVVRVALFEDPIPGDAHRLVWRGPRR